MAHAIWREATTTSGVFARAALPVLPSEAPAIPLRLAQSASASIIARPILMFSCRAPHSMTGAWGAVFVTSAPLWVARGCHELRYALWKTGGKRSPGMRSFWMTPTSCSAAESAPAIADLRAASVSHFSSLSPSLMSNEGTLLVPRRVRARAVAVAVLADAAEDDHPLDVLRVAVRLAEERELHAPGRVVAAPVLADLVEELPGLGHVVDVRLGVHAPGELVVGERGRDLRQPHAAHGEHARRDRRQRQAVERADVGRGEDLELLHDLLAALAALAAVPPRPHEEDAVGADAELGAELPQAVRDAREAVRERPARLLRGQRLRRRHGGLTASSDRPPSPSRGPRASPCRSWRGWPRRRA